MFQAIQTVMIFVYRKNFMLSRELKKIWEIRIPTTHRLFVIILYLRGKKTRRKKLNNIQKQTNFSYKFYKIFIKNFIKLLLAYSRPQIIIKNVT